MPKLDLGQKQLCPSCGAKFYDLGKRPAKCPKCSNSFDPDDEILLATRQAARMSALDVEETNTDEDEDDDQAIKVKAVDSDLEEEELDVEETTKEIDIEAMDDGDLIMGSDGDDDDEILGGGGDSIPEGFSEQDLDEDEELAEEEIPFIEGEDELLEEDLDIDLDDLEEGKEP